MIEVFRLAGPSVILLDELMMFARRPDDARLSAGLSVLLIAAYGLGLRSSLRTHHGIFGSAARAEAGETPWPTGFGPGATLAGVTVLVALVSEVFVESVPSAALRQLPEDSKSTEIIEPV